MADPASRQSVPQAAPRASSRPVKSATAFRTISEVADELEVAQHVLRFWESKFSQVRPLKRGGGRRYYRPEDVELLRQIRDLLYRDGFTIKGAQKFLRESRLRIGTHVEHTDDTPPRVLAGASRPRVKSVASLHGNRLSPTLKRRLKRVRDQLHELRERMVKQRL